MSILSHQLRSVSLSNPADQEESARAQSPAPADSPIHSRAEQRRRSSVWREQVRARLADLRVELDSLPAAPSSEAWRRHALQLLDEATAIIDRPPSVLGAWTGVDIEGAWMRIHAIEVALVRLSAQDIVRAKLPGIIADGSQLLGEDNPRVKALRTYQMRARWKEDDRECLAQSVRAVYEESDKENVRLRSFRNILLGATLALAVLAISFAILGALFPDAVDKIANSSTPRASLHSASPASATDILIIEMLGLISATLVGAVAIRRIKGTSVVYGVPMASLLLKLPMGALTALAGIFLIRAGIGGLPVKADSHLAAYALLFGASQQGFTGLVDRQAHNVLDNVTSKDNG
jgi:hypothetical protein